MTTHSYKVFKPDGWIEKYVFSRPCNALEKVWMFLWRAYGMEREYR